MPYHYEIDLSPFDKADKKTVRRHAIIHLSVFAVGMVSIFLMCLFSMKGGTKTQSKNTDVTAVADTMHKYVKDTATIKQR